MIFQVITHLADKDDAESADGAFVGGNGCIRDLCSSGIERNAVVDDGEVQLIAVDFGSKCHGVGVRMVYHVGHGLFHG